MKRKNRILVVEDNNDINRLLCDILSNENSEVVGAFSGTEALIHINNDVWDLIVLDLMIPGICGEDLILKIREITKTPIIVVSAKNDRETKLQLLNDGADDFIEKPFDPDEVVARVNSNLRRYLEFSKCKEEEIELHYKDIILNIETKEVRVRNEEIKLRLKEFQILELLLRHPNKIFSKSNLYESLWKEDYLGDDNSILVHLSRLRSKLSLKGDKNDYIETVWGIGYRLRK